MGSGVSMVDDAEGTALLLAPAVVRPRRRLPPTDDTSLLPRPAGTDHKADMVAKEESTSIRVMQLSQCSALCSRAILNFL